MTEAEMLEVSNIMWGNAIALLGLAITLISGYLIAAYIAGNRLTQSQAIIINILYMGFACFLVLSMLSFSQNAGELDLAAFQITSYRSTPPRTMLVYVVAFFVLFCVAASLKFMWDIRHPKKE